ncbi:FG-GAP-like repeat-containing protein [Spirosoma panaciterrae]|uniref:FG-GAP-like repeat-containing protein n=1 Tax=Spirosoma panaciterrae TaxID=496058 RepID=UPI000360137F|nr:FG-GAP-like repeat-containing protein [Spirosoma panaciterrae]
MKKLFTLCFLMLPYFIHAQSGGKIGFRYDQTPTVSVNGKPLLNPWAGGLNSAQYSTIRLNNDARDDLVVFDRSTGKVNTFVAIDNPTGSGIAWRYAPEYETAFPINVYSWLLLADYDGDGRKDVFAASSAGVQVLHNESQNGQVVFKAAANPLLTVGLSGLRIPIYVAGTDIPAITDFDDDGDIDIITFDSDGNILAYQQNMSVERTGAKGLDFQRMGNTCWGHFRKEFCNDFTFGFQCDDNVGGRVAASSGTQNARLAKPLHTGNTLTVVDTDGDGHKDLLFGFVSCENIARLKNAGPNNDKANFVSYDSLFPAAAPILFPAFPATYWEDVDGDGQKDLLASPNVTSNDGFAFDFRASNWFYKNTGTTQKPVFQLIQKDFLQNDMLDLGGRAAPALADLDGDGDLDMLVGFGGVGLGSSYRAGIWQFENKGTLQNPAFALVTTDYLGMSKSLTLTNTVPSFADVDGNGSMDLILTGVGTSALEIRVLLNTAAKGSAVQYTLASAVRWPKPDVVGPYDLLTVTDVDRDGKVDMLISLYNLGTILYYRNTGTATAPSFQLQSQTFGGFTNDDYTYAKARSLVVADLNGDQINELIAAADNGTVRVYQFPEKPDQSLTLIDSLASIGVPGKGLIATVGDLDGDQLPDLILGSVSGGLRYLKNTSQKVVITGTTDEPTGPWAFPNPTDRYLTVRPPFAGRVELLSLSGQTMLPVQPVAIDADTVLDLGNLPDGNYLLRLTGDNRPAQVQKIVVWK